jgi:DNA polymerase-3 subunit gamma/tau
MSLYRTYRPRSFAEVIGQDHIVTTLEQAVKTGRVAQAYLFAGARGTGKTSVARILAKILLTKDIKDETLQKQIIKGVDEGTIVDLIEIDAASNRGIDDIRMLVEKIQFTPVAAAAKVYIIDEVHMLTREAFNALLKTLEEPPAYAYFILATTELQKIPATIQSRCQRFLFRQIREDDIIRGLQTIADREHIVVDRAALRSIAHHAQGGMRDAISLLDQLRSLPKVTSDDVKERIGEGGHEHVEAIFQAIERGDRQALLTTIRKVEETGLPLDVLTRLLLHHVRGALHEAIEKNEATDQHAQMLGILLDAMRDLRVAPVPGLVLEAALFSLCGSEQPKSTKGIFKKVTEVIEQNVTVKEPAVQEKSEPLKERAKNEAIVEAPEVSMDSVQSAWSEVLKEVSPASVKMSLKNGRLADVQGQNVVVRFASAFHRNKVAATEASRAIEQVLEKIFKRSLKLQCIVENETGSAPVAESSVDLAEAAAEIF